MICLLKGCVINTPFKQLLNKQNIINKQIKIMRITLAVLLLMIGIATWIIHLISFLTTGESNAYLFTISAISVLSGTLLNLKQ